MQDLLSQCLTDFDCRLSLVVLDVETLPAIAVQKPACEHMAAVPSWPWLRFFCNLLCQLFVLQT